MSKYDKYKSFILSIAESLDFNVNKIATKVAKKEGVPTYGSIKDYVRSTLKKHSEIEKVLISKGIDPSLWDIAWIKTKEGSYRVKKDINELNVFYKKLLEELKSYSVKTKKIKRKKFKEPNLLVLDPADPHFGKRAVKAETGEDTNSIITEKRFKEGVKKLLEKASNFNLEKIILVVGNDMIHVDNKSFSTTNGTLQQTDCSWWEQILIAKKAYIEAITLCTQIADTHVVFCPSNHDYHLGFCIAQMLEAFFHNNSNVTFDTTILHRKYVLYGHNLLGFSHADKGKEASFPDLMKTEAKQAWAAAKFGYWYLHHIHHKNRKHYKGAKGLVLEKDYSDVTVIKNSQLENPTDRVYVEYLRSISGTDKWHFDEGYVGAVKAMEGFIHSPFYGQTDRISIIF